MMFLRTIKRLRRAITSTIALLLFSAVISIIICAMQLINEAEVRHYEETWQSVPITVTVTNLSQTDSKMAIQNWVLDIFNGEEPVKFYDMSGLGNTDDPEEIYEYKLNKEPIELSLTEYVKDIQVNMTRRIYTVNGEDLKRPHLNGMSSLSCDKLLLPEYGCVVTWAEGYDESIFYGDEPVCIIPEGMIPHYDNGNGETLLEFSGKITTTERVNGKYQIVFKDIKYQCTLKIVGTYTAGDEKSIYCPLTIIEQVYSELDANPGIWSISFTLADNSRLEEFREKMSFCFLETSPDIKNVPWNYHANSWRNEYYPYALDINDENLFSLKDILEKSIKFNRAVTAIIVVLSAISGFLVGFLMIRSRKRDIILMRTVGESSLSIYLIFALEQMICIILGVILGGAFNLWCPIGNLAAFVVVYFVGLSLALVIFLNKKLLTSIKEDE